MSARQPVASLAAARPRRLAESITEELRMKTVTRFFQDKSRVTAIEYGLMAALISVVIIASATSVGTNLQGFFDKIGTVLITP
jgi:pilus assembly protein Flp/PilA